MRSIFGFSFPLFGFRIATRMRFVWKKCSVNRFKLKYLYRYDGLNIPRGMRERWSTHNNRIAFLLLMIWSLFEFVLCLAVLLRKKSDDYPENFLNGICTKSCEVHPTNSSEKIYKSSCSCFITVGLIARCLTSITLFIGIFLDSTILMIPWFLNNAIGLFPLGPMIVSSFHDYKDAKRMFKNLKFFWNILAVFLKATFDLFVTPMA